MPSTNPFTEEGRTRFRNFQRRLLTYFALWLIVGSGIGFAGFWYTTRHSFAPLQRLYFKQYAFSTFKSHLPKKKPSRYSLLVRVITDPATGKDVILGCTDEQVEPMLDGHGKLIVDKKAGPYFRLKPELERKLFYWRVTSANDASMRTWFEQNIYDGKSLLGLCYPIFALSFFVAFGGSIATVVLDRRMNRRYEKGERLRGTRAVTPEEYERENGEATGIGLEIFAQQG